MREIKERIRGIAKVIQTDVANGREPRLNDHFRFIGNPGTGKTTMARLFAEALNALGVLPVGHLKEVGADQMISQYVADSPKLVEKFFNQAMGGVLFIDEAYQFTNNEHGKDAVDSLIRYTENYRGKIVVILAGYERDMEALMKLNDGFKSRFNQTISFRDYTPDELAEIFRRMVANGGEGFMLSPEADEKLKAYFQNMYNMRQKGFGNAREVRNAYSATIVRVKSRLADHPSSPPFITPDDITGDEGKLSLIHI